MKKLSKLIAALLSICLLLPMAVGCSDTSDSDFQSDGRIEAVNLMADIKAKSVSAREPDDVFKSAYADFAAELLRGTAVMEREDNLLVSPLSVMLALAMTANGAEGDTLAEMEALLGGTLSMEELNATLHTWMAAMESVEKATLTDANSIWIREKEFDIDQNFLQTNANYYSADLFEAPFNDRTVKDVNQWVKDNTDGLIDGILNQIDPECLMLLINTLYFEAEWSTPYRDHSVKEGSFSGIRETSTVEMMHSTEYTYLETEDAVGFTKSYRGGFKFAALLPNEGIDIGDYVASLTGEKLLTALSSYGEGIASASLPAFSYDCSLELKDMLSAKIPTAFAPYADFTGMGTPVDGGGLWIGNVLHKTHITVDQKGTKAGAVTVVEMANGSAPPTEIHEVVLDRPFVYAIVDNATGLPIFIGVVEQL